MVLAKIYESPASAIEDVVFDGMSMAVGGFGLVGTPEYLLVAIHEKGTKDITVVANNAGAVGKALGLILEAGHIKKQLPLIPVIILSSYGSILRARLLVILPHKEH